MHCFDCDPNVPNDYLPRAKKTVVKRVKVVALSKQNEKSTNFLFTRWNLFSLFFFFNISHVIPKKISFRAFKFDYLKLYRFHSPIQRRHCRLRLSLKENYANECAFWTSLQKKISRALENFFIFTSCYAMVILSETHYELLSEWHVSLWSGKIFEISLFHNVNMKFDTILMFESEIFLIKLKYLRQIKF